MKVETYLGLSRKYSEIMKDLLEASRIKYSFNDIMNSNETRLSFLNELFINIEEDNLSDECLELFENNIDFLHKFINGEVESEISVPYEFFDDMDEFSIIPTQEDLKLLFKLVEINTKIFQTYYDNKKFYLILPDNSFNMNMGRILEIKYRNIAHLLGLNDSDPEESENKNRLLKHFKKVFSDFEKYGKEDSTKLLNIILSEEGQNEMLRINKLTLDFVEKDKKKYPKSYDENGRCKDMKKFIKRFKEEYKDEELGFPTIKFSKYITKCINSLNFISMANITQMILDYNAPRDPNNKEKKVEQDEKDIFLVNVSYKKLSKLIKEYEKIMSDVESELLSYKEGKESGKLIEYLEEFDIKGKEREALLNLIQTYDFVGKHNIKSNEQAYINAKKSIIDHIGRKFEREIHLIGFGTDFEKDEEEIKITELTEPTVNFSHCDTSISINVGELVDKYYKNGRPFFLDKIGDSEGGYLRVSNPVEEEEYNKQMHISSSLEKIREEFNKKYDEYQNSKKKNR